MSMLQYEYTQRQNLQTERESDLDGPHRDRKRELAAAAQIPGR